MGIFSTNYVLLENYLDAFWTFEYYNFYITSLGWIFVLIFVITFALSVIFSYFRPLKYVSYVLAGISGFCLEIIIYGMSIVVVD